MTENEGKPFVTLILATANRAEWLEEPINAILAQHETRFELMLLDCGSEDGTGDVLERFAGDERVRVERLEERDKGIARRQALQRAKGDFVMFPDPHAIWQPPVLERLLRAMGELPASTGVVYCGGFLVNDEGEVVQEVPQVAPQGAVGDALFEAPVIPIAGVMVRYKVLKPLLKTANKFWLENDHALLLWLAGRTAFEPVNEAMMTLRPIEGALPPGLDPVAEARGEAMTKALETIPGLVRARLARRCLSHHFVTRSLALGRAGEVNAAFGCAMRAVMYRPLWFRAWKQVLRLAAGRAS